MWPAVVVALAMAAAVSLYVFRLWASPHLPMRTTPLTSLPGQERHPSFSPDGTQIAFVWDGENGDNQDIYIKVVGAGDPHRLTTHPAADQKPVWSSDGRHIAFVRLSDEGGGIFVIPALGGAERKVGSLTPDHEWAAGPSWSPDGRLLALSERHEAQAPLSIFLASIESLEKQRLTSPPAGSVGDCAPAISPDGRTVAFNRVSAAGGIFLVPIAGGEPTRLTHEPPPFCERLAWTADGRELVFSTSASGGAPESSSSLWRVSASGGTPERLTVGGDNAANPAIASRGNRLAYEQRSQTINIWQIEVPTAKEPSRSATKLIASTRVDACPQFSPDGTRIAFCSDRTGSDEIWVSDAAGSNLVQLTSLGGPMAGTSRWSPDGRRIAFDGDWGIHVIDVDGGRSRRVASDTLGVVPSWSRDGRWIYFASTRTGRSEVWKVPAAGGQAVQITKRGGFAAFESQDGKSLYYAKGIGRRRLVERCGERRRRSTCAGFSQSELLGLLGSGGEGDLLREHRDWPAARSPISELCRETGSACCRAGQKTGSFSSWDGSVSRRKMDSLYPGGPAQQRHHARGELSLNSGFPAIFLGQLPAQLRSAATSRSAFLCVHRPPSRAWNIQSSVRPRRSSVPEARQLLSQLGRERDDALLVALANDGEQQVVEIEGSNASGEQLIGQR